MLAHGSVYHRALSPSQAPMVSVIPASQVSIAFLEDRYSLREATQPAAGLFFGVDAGVRGTDRAGKTVSRSGQNPL